MNRLHVQFYYDITYTLCAEKNLNVCVTSSIKLGQFWQNLEHSLLNKFAAKWCKHFPPHLNNVSTLPCETWNALHVHCTTVMLQKEIPEFSPPQPWPPNSPDVTSWLQHMGNTAREGVQNTHHWSGRNETATGNGVRQAGSDHHCSSHSSVALLPISVRQGWWWSTVSDFCHFAVNDFFCKCFWHEQLPM